MKSFVALFLATVFMFATASTVDENTLFQNKIELRENVYDLYWNFNDTDVTFKIVVANPDGWVGFGLSPNGGMYNSDVVLAWFNPDGTENFLDAHVGPSSGKHRPIVDKYINWKKLFMKKVDGKLIVIFSRKIKIRGQSKTGEVNIEVLISQPVIFAWGSGFEDAERSFPAMHSSDTRNSRTIKILGSLNEDVVIDYSKVESHDFNVKAKVLPGVQTIYFCTMFGLPEKWLSGTKNHLIRYDTFVSDPKLFKYLHHWVVYECHDTYENTWLPDNNNTAPEANHCNNGQEPWVSVNRNCNRISIAWAVGADKEKLLPSKYGYPIGGEKANFKHFYLELHIENPDHADPNFKEVELNMGLKMHVTKEYREIEFGVLMVGAVQDWRGILLPPNQDQLTLENICRKKWMNQLYEEVGGSITIFAEFAHTHLAGKRFFSKLLRNNTEIEYISKNQYYDFNYQYTNFLPKPVVLRKDDEILTTCVYHTEDRKTITTGGEATYQEMCYNFLWYYPRQEKKTQCLQYIQTDELFKFFRNYLEDGLQFDKDPNNLTLNDIGPISEIIRQDAVLDKPKFNHTKRFQKYYDNSTKVQVDVENQSEDLYAPVTITRLVDDDSEVVSTSTTTTSTTITSATTTSNNAANLLSSIYLAMFFITACSSLFL